MSQITRLPAVPVIVNDPYFSIWSAADRPTDRNTTHWAGEDKPLFADIRVDGCKKRLMGLGNEAAMPLTESTVTATATEFVYEDMGVRAKLKFVTPLLMDDPDVLSAPVTYISLTTESVDGKEHEIITHFSASSQLTYSGAEGKPLIWDTFDTKGLKTAYVGRREQKPLSHSGDHITIDWGYLFLAGKDPVTAGEGGLSITGGANLECMIAYEDVASINYFGRLTPAWYARNGKNLVQMLTEMDARRAEILNRCRVLDEKIRSESLKIGGEDYALITAASYRQCLGAHKLIADENGEMVFLSKENDSNGCIGTVDVSYPSIPLMLLENPEFVKGLCRPILKFAEMPVWRYDFAPHDVGRYPNATGQVYAAKVRVHTPNGSTYPPYYLYPASSDPYHFAYQMPVEECGNMLIMLAAAWRADGDLSLVKRHMPTLEKWVRYLIDFGEDPGEQLCTDDFAGHLARNVNLSAKAVCGVAAFGLLKKALGEAETGEKYLALARELAGQLGKALRRRGSYLPHLRRQRLEHEVQHGLGQALRPEPDGRRSITPGKTPGTRPTPMNSACPWIPGRITPSRTGLCGWLPLPRRRISALTPRPSPIISATPSAGWPSATGMTAKTAPISTSSPAAFRAACSCRC